MFRRTLCALLALLLLCAVLPQPAAALSAPSITKVEAVSGGVRLRWGKVSGASRYRVFRQDSRGRWVKLGDTADLTFTDKGATPGHTYTYALRCVTKRGRCTSKYSRSASFSYAKAPQLTSLSNTVSGVQVKWGAVSGVKRYRIYRRTDGGGWQRLGESSSASYLDRTARSGVKYRYTVRCLTADGKALTSWYNAGRSITYLSAPVQKEPTVRGTEVTLRWKRVSGAAAYRVYQRSGTGWKALGDTTALTLTLTALAPNRHYTFTVRCISKDGKQVTSACDPAGRTVATGEAPKLICIDPGHQQTGDLTLEAVGPGAAERKYKVSGGAVGTATGQTEYNLNLIVSRKLAAELERRGYDVILTRTSNQVNLSNQQRTAIGNRAGADLYLRIHANGSGNPDRNGAMTICPSAANPYVSAQVNRDSLRLSNCVLSALCAATGAASEGVSRRDDLTGLNWSEVPVTLIEMGYLSNPAEDRLLATDAYQNRVVQGIADGVDRYFQK